MLLAVRYRYLGSFAPGARRAAARAASARTSSARSAILLGVITLRSFTWFGLITFVPLWEVSLGHSKSYGNAPARR